MGSTLNKQEQYALLDWRPFLELKSTPERFRVFVWALDSHLRKVGEELKYTFRMHVICMHVRKLYVLILKLCHNKEIHIK